MNLFIVFGFVPAFISSMPQHLPGYALSLGLSSQLGATLLSACMLGNILSKLLMGILNDLIGALKATFCLFALTLTSLILLVFVKADLLLIFSSLLLGSSYGLGSVAMPLLTRYLFGIHQYQKIFPRVSFAGNAGAALAFSIIAAIYDATGSYVPALYLLIGLLLMASLILLYVSRLRGKVQA